MNSNYNTNKKKTLMPRNDNKPLVNQKDKTKSYTRDTPIKITAIEILENKCNPISNIDFNNEVKQRSITNDTKTNNKQDGSNQILELKEETQNLELLKMSSLNTRYRLNYKNYVQELHKALIQDCNYNLLDYTSLNASLDFETLTNVTSQTLKAIQDQKIFSVLGYFPTVSLEMKNRGWVEKRDPYRPPTNYSHYLKSAPYMVNWIESPPLLSSINENEAIIERLKSAQSWSILKDKKSDFIFVTRKRLISWSNLSELTSVSQMTRHVFCTKNGLAQCLESYKHFVTNLMFPRCHYIRSDADSDAFVEDYITTALVSTLKIIVKAIENNKTIFTSNGNIPYNLIDFVKRCITKFLNKHITGSTEIDLWTFNSQKEVWNEFMIYYTKLIIDSNAKFDHEYTYELELDVYAKCKYLLENVKKYCPQHYIDGITNTWIIKPSSNCSGHGIMLSRDLHSIKRKIAEAGVLKNNYILQKYIERPLLVNTCKIDLRQWFLVTNMSPVVVWMYKEGYVRFCANSFSMLSMHESIHLSNVRLQMKYRKFRNPLVPDECMWDYRELQDYLRNIGQEYVWDELIFPGMGESIYAVLKAATDISFYRDKTFQLFGADFLITENFIPYLIEINSIPGLNPSTSIIANLVPMLLSDIVKVTVDYEKNSNADTGLFMKVVPENLKSASVVKLDSSEIAANNGNLYNSTEATVDRGCNKFNLRVGIEPTPFTTEYHHQWMNGVNKKLASLRLRINTQKTTDDSGVNCSSKHRNK
ncbi:tubulin glycylase 3A-like [Rhopalosiphum maidis]|uniref:tubulin glycylase 3A-like n=1 Tax=Rhopalosiphum maidis TaxID=43146 RepID=UPI000EFE18A4|nr:tubulin glycylase 3A-like [Rhopalosiphum maidis]